MQGTTAWPLIEPIATVATRVGVPVPPGGADVRLPIERVFALWADVARATDATVPLRVARSLRLDQLGLMGFTIMTAESGHDALVQAIRFAPLVNDSGRWSLEIDAERVTVSWTRDGDRELGHRIANEAAVAEFVCGMREICGARFAPSGVRFRHAAPAVTAAHRAFFGCPVAFGGDADAFWFPRRALDVVPSAASRALAALVREQAEARLRGISGSVTAQVRDAIDRALRVRRRPEADAVALELGVSERTLRRQLASEGSSFSRVLDEMLRGRALTLVGAGTRPLTDVAIELGFSDASAFSHAFKRWHGCSPRELRARRRCRSPHARR